MAQIRPGCISLNHCSPFEGWREQVTKQGVLKFGAGEEKACGEHTGLISVPRSVPEVLEKGMLPEVF